MLKVFIEFGYADPSHNLDEEMKDEDEGFCQPPDVDGDAAKFLEEIENKMELDHE